MRILFLAAWYPLPPDNGARMRTYYLLRELTRCNEVDLLAFVRDGRDVPPVGDALRARCLLLGTAPLRAFHPQRVGSLIGLLSPLPRSVRETYSPEMDALVGEALGRGRYDVVVTSEIGPSFTTTRYVAGRTDVPHVVEDVELRMIHNKMQAQRTVWGRLRHRLTWWKLRRYAAWLLSEVAGCTVASDLERETLEQVAPQVHRTVVIPNGVDPSRYDGDFGPVEPDTLVFPGSLTYSANLLAMEFFLEGVMPRIVARRPGVRLFITGRTEGVDLARLPLSDNVILTGYLEDVRPRIARSKVCVVPITTGGGTRLKVLEAMALGVPVVATTKGAEGLEVRPGEDILLADEPEAFAAQVVRLLEDPALRERLARNGRRLVRERYDWREIGRRFEAFLEQVVAEWNDVDIS